MMMTMTIMIPRETAGKKLHMNEIGRSNAAKRASLLEKMNRKENGFLTDPKREITKEKRKEGETGILIEKREDTIQMKMENVVEMIAKNPPSIFTPMQN